MRRFSFFLILTLALSSASALFAADSLYEVVEKAQKVINQKYPDESSIARKMAMEELERIALSDKSDAEKIAVIQDKFPDQITLIIRSAEQGDPDAQYKLGVCYSTGEGVKQDYAEAVKWFRKAAEQGHAQGQYNLGLAYEDGNGVTKDYAEAVKWFRKAAEQGHAQGQYNLGLAYEDGNGVTKDYAEAAKWYRKAADQGHAEALFKLGLAYEDGNGVTKDYAEAVNLFRKAAEQGHAEAQCELGLCYYNGNGVTKDYAEAAKWYRKAADQGLARAQCDLGNCYFYGYGVREDNTEAVKWYRKAAEQGHAQAQYDLGYCYNFGKGLKKDNTEAVKWYRKAAEQGHAQAQYNLGLAYEDGEGVAKDYTEAVKWFRKAVEQGWDGATYHLKHSELFMNVQNGNAEGQYKLGLAYETGGNGIKKDYNEAVKWFRKAAEQEYAEAQFRLGLAYEDGRKGVAKDYAEAVKWFCKAAEQEYAEAQYNLGLAYEDGKGVAKDYTEAVKWFRKAAEQGHAGAKAVLEGKNIELPSGTIVTLVKIEAGSFEMSAKDGENESDEVPHRATLTKDFYLGQTEVTQAQWRAVMGTDPSEFKGDDFPVEQVSWYDAMEFCDKLNTMGKAPKGWMFILPTETQWEYAARGGKKSKGYKYSGSNNIDEVAWYAQNSSVSHALGETHPVGQKKENELGLYDMSGNVHEWCLDDWNADSSKQKAEFKRGNDQDGSYRVARGGSWFDYYGAKHCRSSTRAYWEPVARGSFHGFRIALVLCESD